MIYMYFILENIAVVYSRIFDLVTVLHFNYNLIITRVLFMAKAATIQARIEPHLKKRADRVLKKLG